MPYTILLFVVSDEDYLIVGKGTKTMTVSYNGLWKKMIDKNLQKQDLVKELGLSSATVAKMGKGEPVSSKVLEKLSNYFECNVSEIMAYE